MNITTKILVTGTGCTELTASQKIEFVQAALDEFQINTPRRISGFLANVGEESGGLLHVIENLNYSAARLAIVWPNRYSMIDEKTGQKVPNDLAKKLAYNPVALANNVYANRMGNGNEASGDGWKYRGVGWIQTTGKTNITRALVALGFGSDADPSILQEQLQAARSAAYFWSSNGCNELLDKDMFSASVKVVNGALPCTANNGPIRLQRYRACVKLF